VAVKGLGGFTWPWTPPNPDAVKRLRRRKHREEKPLALMCATWIVRAIARVQAAEEKLLTSIQRPIVLLRKAGNTPIAEEVSPRNRYFGIMLPYTPLHHLLLDYGFTALVMTSANLSEEPIAIDNDEAFSRLGGIADDFLVHNRDILPAQRRLHRAPQRRPHASHPALPGLCAHPVFLKTTCRRCWPAGPS
jgi:hydrogenase maturation protein HypF